MRGAWLLRGALRAVSVMYVRVSFDARCVAGMFALVRPFHTIRQKLAAEQAMPGFGAGFRHVSRRGSVYKQATYK